MYQCNVPNIPTVIYTIFFGLFHQNLNSYDWLLEIDIFNVTGLMELDVLHEDGGLTVEGWVGDRTKRFKRRWNGKKG